MEKNSIYKIQQAASEKFKKIFGNKNLWYLFGITCGALVAAYGSQLLFKQVILHHIIPYFLSL